MTLTDDWQIGPRNRWAYQHVGEVVPTVCVACGSAAPLRAGTAPHPGVPGSILEYLATIGPAERPHGALFHYVSPNTDLLGIATARAAGAPLPELIARESVGADRGGVRCRARRRPGRHARHQRRLLRDAARLRPARRVRAGTVVLGARLTSDRDDPRAVGYGSQWWRLPGDVLAARGIHGQLVAVDRGSSTVTVMLSSWPAATDQDAEAAQFALIGHPLV